MLDLFLSPFLGILVKKYLFDPSIIRLNPILKALKSKSMKTDLQDIFKEIILKKISIEEFEKQIYFNSELEQNIGKLQYLDLISFNYKQKDAYYELLKFLNQSVIPQEDQLFWKIRRFFSQFGWYEGRKIDLDGYIFNGTISEKKALAITEEFGGLEINKAFILGNNFRDILFFKMPYTETSSTLGSISFFASFSDSYAYICIDNNGNYYAFYDVINQFDFLGQDFENVMEKILF